jgi:CheY-like chemotaxis protein
VAPDRELGLQLGIEQAGGREEGEMSPAEDIIPAMADNGPVILVAEDEVLVRLAVSEHLRADGFTVIEAASAEEVRAVLLSGLEVDLVFSDIQMAGEMDGVALAQWLAINHPDIPVLLTSGAASSLAHARPACAQVKEFLVKPYEHDVLVARIRVHLARRARIS